MEILTRKYRNKLTAKVSPEHAVLTAERIVQNAYPTKGLYNCDKISHREIWEMAEVLLAMVAEKKEFTDTAVKILHNIP